MTLQDVGIVGAMVTALGGVVSGAGTYYLDIEYVAQSDLKEYFIKRDIKDYSRQLRQLQRIPDNSRTDREKWQMDDLEDDVEDLKQQLILGG